MFITDLSNNRKIKIKPIYYLISVAADCISNRSILENSKLKPKSTLGKDTKQNFWWTSRFRCCNVCATKHAHNGHCFDFFLCAFCVSVGTSGSQLTITMMKLKVMKEKKKSPSWPAYYEKLLHWVSWLGAHQWDSVENNRPQRVGRAPAASLWECGSLWGNLTGLMAKQNL